MQIRIQTLQMQGTTTIQQDETTLNLENTINTPQQEQDTNNQIGEYTENFRGRIGIVKKKHENILDMPNRRMRRKPKNKASIGQHTSKKRPTFALPPNQKNHMSLLRKRIHLPRTYAYTPTTKKRKGDMEIMRMATKTLTKTQINKHGTHS